MWAHEDLPHGRLFRMEMEGSGEQQGDGDFWRRGAADREVAGFRYQNAKLGSERMVSQWTLIKYAASCLRAKQEL